MKAYDLKTALENRHEVTELDLSRRYNPLVAQGSSSFPEEVFELKALEKLKLESFYITELPAEIASLTKLVSLELPDNGIEKLPDALLQLPLKKLNLRANGFFEVPEVVLQMKGLKELDLGVNYLREIPESLFDLKELTHLDLSETAIEHLPRAIGRLKKLRKFQCSTNELTELPASLFQCKSLEDICLSYNMLAKIPEGIGKLELLEKLDLANNRLTHLPASLGQCRQLRRLLVNNNHLRKLPDTICECRSLTGLLLGDNQLKSLPRNLGNCKRLGYLVIGGNRLRKLPSSLMELPRLVDLAAWGNELSKWPSLPESLVSLDLSNNPVKSIPAALGKLKHLEKLDIGDTQIRKLPESIGQLQNLAHLRVINVPLQDLPKGLFHIENMRLLEGLDDEKGDLFRTMLLLKGEDRPALHLRKPLFEAKLGARQALSRIGMEDLVKALGHPLGVKAPGKWRQRRKGILDFETILRAEIFQRSNTLSQQPLQAGAVLAVIGESAFDLPQLEIQLQKQGIILSEGLNREVTHVLLGERPSYHPLLSKRYLVFVNEYQITRFLRTAGQPGLVANLSEEEIDNLRNLLKSKDEGFMQLALQMMLNNGLPPSLMNDLLAMALAQGYHPYTDETYDLICKLMLRYLPEKSRPLLGVEGISRVRGHYSKAISRGFLEKNSNWMDPEIFDLQKLDALLDQWLPE